MLKLDISIWEKADIFISG